MKYDLSNVWAFEVYGPFGRTIAHYEIDSGQTHHQAQELARLRCLKENKAGKKAWVRLKN